VNRLGLSGPSRIEYETSSRIQFWKKILVLGLLLGACAGASALVYRIPWVYARAFWRIDILRGRVRGILSPHAEIVSTPDAALVAMVQATLTAIAPAATVPSPTDLHPPTGTGRPTQALTPSLAPTATSTPVPTTVTLTGARHEPQLYNNCGPATLTAVLVYWGWRGSEPDELIWHASGKDIRWQSDIASVLKPNQPDRNVMPEELATFATEYAGLKAAVRYGGDLDTVRRLVAGGFPVILERGFREEEHGIDDAGWEGHYSAVTGYDDAARKLLTQDSYLGANYWRDYDLITRDWRAFNYTFLILYPAEREAEVLELLGPLADEFAARQLAVQRAQQEVNSQEGVELAFAWFNLGTSLNALRDYAGAAAAFDQARLVGLPWRMLWYQTGPYRAYFNTARYQDVIDLTTATLSTVDNLEESYYWRGLAYQALGRQDAAIADWKRSLDHNPNFGPGSYQLDLLGVSH